MVEVPRLQSVFRQCDRIAPHAAAINGGRQAFAVLRKIFCCVLQSALFFVISIEKMRRTEREFFAPRYDAGTSSRKILHCFFIAPYHCLQIVIYHKRTNYIHLAQKEPLIAVVQ